MKDKDFAPEIERARTRLQADYRHVTVSATQWRKTVFVSVKTPYWTHEMERLEEDAPDMPLSEWICREVRLIHAPDILITKQISPTYRKPLYLTRLAAHPQPPPTCARIPTTAFLTASGSYALCWDNRASFKRVDRAV